MKRQVVTVLALCLALASPAMTGELLEKSKDDKKRGEARDDDALVYVVRTSKMGSAIKFWAFADEQLLGVTRGKSYAFAHVPPGRHLFWSKAENTAVLELEVAAGQTYYLKQKVKMGFGKARVGLALMSEKEARAALEKCAHVELTEEGKARGAEIAAERYERVREKASKS